MNRPTDKKTRLLKNLSFTLITIIGLSLSLSLFFITRSWENERYEKNFIAETIPYQSFIQNTLDNYVNELYALQRFYKSSHFVSPKEFANFVEPVLAKHSEIQAFEWIPLITHQNRMDHEKQMQDSGYSGYTITERNQEGEQVTAQQRKNYFPVSYVYPMKGNESVLGYDLGSNDLRLAALIKARDTGSAVATSRIKLVQTADDSYGFLIFLPIYKNNVILNTTQQRREKILGFVLSVIHIKTIIQAVVSQLENKDINIVIHDISALAGNQLLYEYTLLKNHDHPMFTPLITHNANINIGTRNWNLSFTPGPHHHSLKQHQLSWIILVIGIMLTSCLILFTIYHYRRTKIIEALVEKRTQQLKQSEFRHHAIQENIVDGIISMNKFGIIETINPAVEHLFGYHASELIGSNINQLMPMDIASQHDQFLKNYLTTGEAKIIGIGREVICKKKNGQTFPADLSISEMSIDQEHFFVGSLRDISERKNLEKMQSEFVAIVSHELRTPLTSIKGSIGLLLGDVLGELPKPIRSMLDIANSNSERLLLLINDLLDIEKISSGQMDFKFETIDVMSLVNNALDVNAGYAEKYDVHFNITESIKEAYIYCDSNRLLQVMNNLMSNAAKFSPINARIGIAVYRHAQQIRISVTDCGPGIPDNFHHKIFEKFTQSDSSDTRKVGGTGLGLNISKEIIEKHHGKIDFTTEEGKGSCFYFDLPEVSNQKQLAS